MRLLKVQAGVRYYQDGKVNGEDDITYVFKWLQNGNYIQHQTQKTAKLQQKRQFYKIAIFSQKRHQTRPKPPVYKRKMPKSCEFRHFVDDAGVEPATR